MATVLAIPDLHAPWHHPRALAFLAELKRQHRPDAVVCLGDEADCAAWSAHPKCPSMPSPAEELKRTREALKPLYKLFPDARVCTSNHVDRIAKRAAEVGFPPELIRDVDELFGAPRGWKRALRHEIDGVVYFHGEGFGGANGHVRAATAYRRPVVIGHLHAHAGVNYLTGLYDRIWGMNCGCLLDPDAPAFNYGKHMANRPTLGAGVVRDGVPHFHPLPHK